MYGHSKSTIRAKELNEGGTVNLNRWKWQEGSFQERYEVRVTFHNGVLFRLPTDIERATREIASRIYEAITPEETVETFIDRIDELDNI